MTPPEELLDLPRSVFDTATSRHYFDQIAWFTAGNQEQLTMSYTKRAGQIAWTSMRLSDLTNTAKSWRVSDHYPLYTQFALP